jgi:hypothetical protein
MRWAKRGLIFDPRNFNLLGATSEYAQSPQALVCADRVRIYFSTRERERSGKFLSHIAFVDFDRQIKNILGVSSQPVISLGKLGCFDEHGIFPMHVFRSGDRILAYTSGWSRRFSVSVETSIGLAISHDGGNTFERIGNGPILTSSLQEPFLVGDPFVMTRYGVWHLWYIYGTRWVQSDVAGSERDRVYKIGHATSADGINWNKAGVQLIADRLNADECQALPTVIEHGDQHHMYFCYREAIDFRKNRLRGYRLGHAYSDDLRSWIRDDEHVGVQLSDTGWDADMMCYPHVFRCDGTIYMLYNGNEFGREGFGLAVLEDA